MFQELQNNSFIILETLSKSTDKLKMLFRNCVLRIQRLAHDFSLIM